MDASVVFKYHENKFTEQPCESRDVDSDRILIIGEDGLYLSLKAHEVSGRRLYIVGEEKSLVKVFQDTVLLEFIEDLAISFDCKTLQIQTNVLDITKFCAGGFYASNYIFEKKINKIDKEYGHEGSSISELSIDEKIMKNLVMNEYQTKINYPEGVNRKYITYNYIKKEYIEMLSSGLGDTSFRVYTYKDYGEDAYFILYVDENTQKAIRCFSWVAPKLRGQRIATDAFKEIESILVSKNIESFVSFVSILNINQILSVIRSGYTLNQIVLIKDVD